MRDSDRPWKEDKDKEAGTLNFSVTLTLIPALVSSVNPDNAYILGVSKLARSFQKLALRGIWTSNLTGAWVIARILSQRTWLHIPLITCQDLREKLSSETKEEAKERIYKAVCMIAKDALEAATSWSDGRKAFVISHPDILDLLLAKITSDMTIARMRPGSTSYIAYHLKTNSFSVIELNKTEHLDEAEAELRFLHTHKDYR